MEKREEPANRLWLINRGNLSWSELASNHNEMMLKDMSSAHTSSAGEWFHEKWSNTVFFFGREGSPGSPANIVEFTAAIQRSQFFNLFSGVKIKLSNAMDIEAARLDCCQVFPAKQPS